VQADRLPPCSCKPVSTRTSSVSAGSSTAAWWRDVACLRWVQLLLWLRVHEQH
jgi:hypothetical protein